jgi:hypothetical protein
VGWITNFIHQRNHVHITMLRGWSASTFANAVDRELVHTIADRHQARGSKSARRGFLLDAEERLAKKRKVTMKGSGDIGYTAHNKNSSWIDPAATDDNGRQLFRGLNTEIMKHAEELDLRVPHQLSTRALQLTSGVHINGRPWKKGVYCFYFLRTDRRIDAPLRVAKVASFVVTRIGVHEHLFLCLDQRRVVDNTKSIISFDVTAPPKYTYVHVDHITHLAGSLPYFFAGRADVRCGVPIAPTL